MAISYFKYVFSVLIFGFNGIVARYIDMNSYEIVFMRAMIGGIFLLVVYLFSKDRTGITNKKDFFCLLISGISMGASWMFLYEAYDRIGVSLATLTYYGGPVIVIALSPWLFKEKFVWLKVLGFVAVIIGIFLINGNIVIANGDFFGVFCGIMSAITYSMMVIFNKKAKSIVGLKNSTLQLLIAFVLVALFVGFKQGFSINLTATSIVPILFLGILNTGVGCYLYFSSIGKLPSQTVAICGYVEPLISVVCSVILLSEIMTPLQIVGAILVLGGAVYAEIIGNRRSREKIPIKENGNVQ